MPSANSFNSSVRLVEEFVESDEVRTFHIPMGLFGLKPQVQNVGELLIQQIDHRATSFIAQVILSLMEFRFHKWRPQRCE